MQDELMSSCTKDVPVGEFDNYEYRKLCCDVHMVMSTQGTVGNLMPSLRVFFIPAQTDWEGQGAGQRQRTALLHGKQQTEPRF